MTGAVLIVIGVVALFAAIVGGGIKIKEIEVGSVPSIWRQALLGIFGLVVGTIGLAMYFDWGKSSTTNAAATENAGTTSEPDSTVDENAVEGTAAETNTPDTNAPEPGAPNQADAPADGNAE